MRQNLENSEHPTVLKIIAKKPILFVKLCKRGGWVTKQPFRFESKYLKTNIIYQALDIEYAKARLMLVLHYLDSCRGRLSKVIRMTEKLFKS